MRGVRIVIGLVVLGIALGAGRAEAHLAFVRSDPAANATLAQPPAAVVLVFSGPADPAASTGQVTVGGRVVSGPPVYSGNEVRLPITTPSPGVHSVTYRVIDPTDRHPTEGSFTFTVAPPVATTAVATPTPAPPTATPRPSPSPSPSPARTPARTASPTPTVEPSPSPAPEPALPVALLLAAAVLAVAAVGGSAYFALRRRP